MVNEALDKAGVVIYGPDAQGKRQLIVPYTEGRFGYKHKYYAVPIGSIDPNESPREAACRETLEETGIDVRKLIGEDAYQAFIKGEKLEMPIQSPGYPGVRVHLVDPVPEKYTYISRANQKKHCALYGIEVENIEALTPYLKNLENAEVPLNDNRSEKHMVKTSVQQMVADPAMFPQFDDFMKWLRSGNMPDRLLKEGQEKPAPLYHTPLHGDPLFVRLEKKYCKGGHINSPKELQKFCDKLNRDEDRLMGEYFTKIKKTVYDLGILTDDHGCLKLDDKDSPLTFFQEGAEIISAADYFKQCEARYKDSKSYYRAFGGAGAKFVKKEDRPDHSQLKGMGAFIPSPEIDATFGNERIIPGMSRSGIRAAKSGDACSTGVPFPESSIGRNDGLPTKVDHEHKNFWRVSAVNKNDPGASIW